MMMRSERPNPQSSGLRSVRGAGCKAALLALALLLGAPLANASATAQPQEPELHEALRQLTRTERIAGTHGTLAAAAEISRRLTAVGWRVRTEESAAVMALPRRLALSIFADADAPQPLLTRVTSFDPDAIPIAPLPPFAIVSASGQARGAVVNLEDGSDATFVGLGRASVQFAGTIGLVRSSSSGAGTREALLDIAVRAAGAGCVGLLVEKDAIGHGQLRERSKHCATASIPILILSKAEAAQILEGLRVRRMQGLDGQKRSMPVGPGPFEVQLECRLESKQRTLHNVIAQMGDESQTQILAAARLDGWSAGDSEHLGGTLSLLHAGEIIGATIKSGGQPLHSGITLCFFDGEHQGQLGSSAFFERHAEDLKKRALVYVDMDATASSAMDRSLVLKYWMTNTWGLTHMASVASSSLSPRVTSRGSSSLGGMRTAKALMHVLRQTPSLAALAVRCEGVTRDVPAMGDALLDLPALFDPGLKATATVSRWSALLLLNLARQEPDSLRRSLKSPSIEYPEDD